MYYCFIYADLSDLLRILGISLLYDKGYPWLIFEVHWWSIKWKNGGANSPYDNDKECFCWRMGNVTVRYNSEA